MSQQTSSSSSSSPRTTTTTTTTEFVLYHCGWIHSISLDRLEVVKNGWLLVNSNTGIIEFVAKEEFYVSSGAIDPERPSKNKGPVDPTNKDLKIEHVLRKGEGEQEKLQHFIRSRLNVQTFEEAIEKKKLTFVDLIGCRKTDETTSLNRFFIPGLIDCHAHAPQYAQTGTGLDLPLLDWLNNYTFPLESRFSDPIFVRRVYTKAIDRFLRNGTTTCVWYGTIQLEANKLLVDLIHQFGQRAYVGKVCMDHHEHSPSYYVEKDADESMKNTEALADYIQKELRSPLITPILTPRFAPCCTPELMDRLAKFAAQRSLPIQTHLSESKGEVIWVRSLFPGRKYTQVYDDHGLLTPRTIMAHCIHLDEDEITLLKDREVGIAHCPISNYTIHSGEMRTRDYLRRGLKVGLGTDVSAGYSPSIIATLRQTIIASNARAFRELEDREKQNQEQKKETELVDSPPLSYQEAFGLATLGGSQVVGMEKQLGNFEVGKWFDALMIDPRTDDSSFDVFEELDTSLDIFQKFLTLGDDRNIVQIYVNAKMVHLNKK